MASASIEDRTSSMIEIFCSRMNYYEKSNPNDSITFLDQTLGNEGNTASSKFSEAMSINLSNFLRKQGINANYVIPASYGVQAGGPGLGMIATTSRMTLGALKLIKLLGQWKESHAKKARRNLLPTTLVRLELAPHYTLGNFKPQHNELEQVKYFVSIIKELHDFLQNEYPMNRFEYMLIAPKAKNSCFSICFTGELVTNKNLVKLTKSLSKRKSVGYCAVSLRKKLLVFSKIVFSDRHKVSNKPFFNVHSKNCEFPEYQIG